MNTQYVLMGGDVIHIGNAPLLRFQLNTERRSVEDKRPCIQLAKGKGYLFPTFENLAQANFNMGDKRTAYEALIGLSTDDLPVYTVTHHAYKPYTPLGEDVLTVINQVAMATNTTITLDNGNKYKELTVYRVGVSVYRVFGDMQQLLSSLSTWFIENGVYYSV